MAAGAVQRGLDRLAIDSVAVAVAMARDAPAHRELLDLNGPVERLHLAVTALTLDARPPSLPNDEDATYQWNDALRTPSED